MNAIWAKEIRAVKNHTVAFTYKMKATENDTVKLAAASVFRFFVNGKMMGYGPARAAHGYSRLDEYSLAEFAGQDVVLCVEVFAHNINTYYVVDELPFFACEIVRGGGVIAEAKDFDTYLVNDRLTKVQRFSFQRAFVESYKMDVCRQKFYAGDFSVFPKVETEAVEMNKLLPRIVSYPTFDEVDYKAVVERGNVVVDPDKATWKDRAIYNISDSYKGYKYDEMDECLCEEASRFIFTATEGKCVKNFVGGQYASFDFGRTVTGFNRLVLDVKKDTLLYLTFDEVITPTDTHMNINPFRNECTNVIKYVLAPGKYDLLGFEPNSARFTNIVVVEGELELEKFCMVAYENPDVMAYDKSTGDADFDLIVDAAKNTLAQNAVDVLTDCPSRERAGWLCDSFFSSRAEYFFTGKNLVEKSFIEAYLLSPQSEYLGEGMLPMCYPADHPDGVHIPNWPMWFVLELYNYVKRTGDTEILELSKPRIYGLIGFFKRFFNEDGLLENLENWVFVEWSKCNDDDYIKGVNYPSNMLYAATLIKAGEMYGDDALIAQGEAMKKTIREQSFNGTYFEENAVRVDGKLQLLGHLTETCQYYAIYFDVATKEEYPELYRRMMDEFGPLRDTKNVHPEVYPSNAIVGNSLRFEIMYEDEMYDQVLKEAHEYFLPMAKLTGTLWEHNNVSHSLNHAFASLAAMFVVKSLENKK